MEDVHQLMATGREESYLFLVDSRTRDPSVFPTPSHYEISFASPFRNVFGLDLLDATVARTEYIVESNTNVLEYAMGQPASLAAWNQGAWARSVKRRIELAPGDYNLAQFVQELNDALEASARTHGEDPIVVAPLTNPGEISNRVSLTCASPFTLLMAGSTLRHTLGFGDPVTTSTSTGNYAMVPGWSVNRTEGASDAFLSLPASERPDQDPRTATQGPVPAGSGVQYEAVYGSQRLRQYFTSLTTGPASLVLVFVRGTASCPRLTIAVRRVSDGAVLGTGTLDVTPNDPNDVYTPRECVLVASGVLEAGTAYYVEFAAQADGGSSTQYVGVYYNRDNLPVEDTRYMSLNGATVHPGNNLCCDVSAASWGHEARSPGLVNLTGPRYVSIRCPEIESHMFRDRVNERCHAGLGMVQLRGYGFREQRFDFVSFPPRRFHPIGKLSKLTFRLERPDGTPYDSHGVDHTLLLVLKFYALPHSGTGGDRDHARRLNPHYVPDLRKYMIERRWAEEARATDPTYKVY